MRNLAQLMALSASRARDLFCQLVRPSNGEPIFCRPIRNGILNTKLAGSVHAKFKFVSRQRQV